MFGHVNKALLKQVKVVDQKICGAVLDPDLPSSPMELPKLTGINDHTINLIEKTLKTYVETNLTKGFIWSSKSTRAPKLISLEAANLWIAWAVPDIVFHPVGSDRRVQLEEHL